MRTVRAKIFSGIVLIAGAGMAILAIVLISVTHRHIINQTDALLLQLARLEVSSMIEEQHIHLHEMNIEIPGPGYETERFALIYDHSGQVLTQTNNLTTLTALPEALTHHSQTAAHEVYLTELVGIPLRLVVVPCSVIDQELFFAVGVPVRAIESSNQQVLIWGMVLAALAFLAVASSGYWVARSVTVDLEEVHGALDTIDLQVGLRSRSDMEDQFTVSPGSTLEVSDLVQTIRGLLARVSEVYYSQERFLAEAAHELRTPITAIRGELELALRRERTSETYRETIKLVLEDAIRLQELAEVLLDSARARANPDVSRYNLAELLRDSLRRQHQLLDNAGIHVDVSIDDALEIDANQLAVTRVFDNILSNTANWSGASKLLIKTQFEGDRVILTVADDGAGIPESMLPNLFLPFNRGDQRQGHGLGLYLVHTLMIAQKASIDYCPGTVAGYPGATWRLDFVGRRIMATSAV